MNEKNRLPIVHRYHRNMIQRSTSTTKIPTSILAKNDSGDEYLKMKMCGMMTSLSLEYLSESKYEDMLVVLHTIDINLYTECIWDIHVDFTVSYISILIELNEYTKCEEVCNRMVDRCVKKEDLKTLVVVFDLLAKTFYRLMDFPRALRAYYMLLKISLKVRDHRNEADCYEKIGLVYFNMNQMDKAEYFHRKMINGFTEPEDSMARKKTIIKQVVGNANSTVKNRFVNQLVEDEVADMEGIFFEPLGVEEKYKGISDKKRSTIELMDSLEGKRRIGSVEVYANTIQMETVARMGLIKKPTNVTHSSISYASTNRGIQVFDSLSAKDSSKMSGFRFWKYGKTLALNSRSIIGQLLEKQLAQFDESKRRMRRRKPGNFSIHVQK